MPLYFAATSLEMALDFLARGRADIVAGGTDFFPAKNRDKPQGDILDITRIAGFSEISETPKGWRIGAAVSFSAMIGTPLPALFDALKDAGRQIGSVQIQNAATLVGNLCNASPAADSVPVLMAMGAQIEIASRQGVRILSIKNFITGVRKTALKTDEIVTAIVIPKRPIRTQSAFEKLGSRSYLVISIAMVAVVIEVVDGRISLLRVAVGACSPVAMRLTALEDELQGELVGILANFPVTMTHLAGLSPLDDLRGSAAYRLEVVTEIIQRILRRVAHG